MTNSHTVMSGFADAAVALEILNPAGSFLKIRSWVGNYRGERLESVGRRLVAGLLTEVIGATVSEEEADIIGVDSPPRWQDQYKEVRTECSVHPDRFCDIGFSQVAATFVEVFKRKLAGELLTV